MACGQQMQPLTCYLVCCSIHPIFTWSSPVRKHPSCSCSADIRFSILLTKIDTYDPDIVGESLSKTYHSARLQALMEASLLFASSTHLTTLHLLCMLAYLGRPQHLTLLPPFALPARATSVSTTCNIAVPCPWCNLYPAYALGCTEW